MDGYDNLINYADDASTTLSEIRRALTAHDLRRVAETKSTGWYSVTARGGQPRRAYISGAISADTGEGRERKLQKFAEAEAFLAKRGWAVVNPLEVGACADGSCVERDGAPEPGSSQSDEIVHSWKCYMRNDIRALMECDIIVMIPGWTQSRGAIAEYDAARSIDIPAKFLRTEHMHDGAQTLANHP